MNKAKLIEVIAKRSGVSAKQSEEFLATFVAVTTETLQHGEEVTITGFGAFMPKFRSSRMGVNPQNPSERIQVPAVTVPKFKAGKVLKDALKNVAQTHPPSPASPSSVGRPHATTEAPISISPEV